MMLNGYSNSGCGKNETESNQIWGEKRITKTLSVFRFCLHYIDVFLCVYAYNMHAYGAVFNVPDRIEGKTEYIFNMKTAPIHRPKYRQSNFANVFVSMNFIIVRHCCVFFFPKYVNSPYSFT